MTYPISEQPLVDIGANLAHDSFDVDRSEVVRRACHHGVQQMVITGSSEASSERAARLAAQSPTVLYSTAGIHPHHAEDVSSQTFSVLKDLLRQSQVVCIGETGLDFFRHYSTPRAQQRSFEAHIELAIDLRLPLFLHCRDAHERFIDILKTAGDQLPPSVLHCFTGTEDELKTALELGLYIGITGWICDERRGQHLKQLMPIIPSDRLMIETDAPYLLPRDLDPKPKERRNEPMYLAHIAQTIALATGTTAQRVARQSTEVARAFFKLSMPIEEVMK